MINPLLAFPSLEGLKAFPLEESLREEMTPVPKYVNMTMHLSADELMSGMRRVGDRGLSEQQEKG